MKVKLELGNVFQSLSFGPPGTVTRYSLPTDPGKLVDLLIWMEVWADSSSATISDVGTDDTLALVALPNTVAGSESIGTFFLGNIRHVAPRIGKQHCVVSCDGRQQECCIECGKGHSKSKICC